MYVNYKKVTLLSLIISLKVYLKILKRYSHHFYTFLFENKKFRTSIKDKKNFLCPQMYEMQPMEESTKKDLTALYKSLSFAL